MSLWSNTINHIHMLVPLVTDSNQASMARMQTTYPQQIVLCLSNRQLISQVSIVAKTITSALGGCTVTNHIVCG